MNLNDSMVGLGGLEPPTSRLSGVRSNHLSYKPICLSFYEPTALLLVLCGTHIHQYVPFLETRVPCIFAKILRILLVFCPLHCVAARLSVTYLSMRPPHSLARLVNHAKFCASCLSFARFAHAFFKIHSAET